MEMEYQQCVFCGWCRPIKYGGREVSFDKVDPSQVKVWQLRELTGGVAGQPKGGHIRTIESKTIRELPQEEKEKIRQQAQRIVDICK